MNVLKQWLGSVLFTLYLFFSLPPYAFLVVITAPFFTRSKSMRIAVAWVESVFYMLDLLCDLNYSVEGEQHLQGENTVILMKHSSAWETLAQFKLFPEQTWVLKRELMWAPFLGWALSVFKPIAINRQDGKNAVEQVIEQGCARLKEGLWVVVFPEGTRVPLGVTKRYGLGGALLAKSAEKPVIPVVHNAGNFWPRRGWLKRPGTIQVVVGKPIPSVAKSARSLNEEAQSWIEKTLGELN
ncbi:MAG: lysophospholipid acyltransferase family protein [Gammaproteobacteria bacterium]|nr:lysophospholipid acyltransferase family protein [Gammaproteobacteria bacterium]